MKRTKLIATLGPASEELPIIKQMIRAGLNCARFNFSHGTYANFDKIIKNVKQAAQELGQSITLIQDLQGPKMRVGQLPPEGLDVKKNQIIILTTQSAKNKKLRTTNHQLRTTNYELRTPTPLIPIQYKKLPNDVKPGQTILIDDGLIELKVLSTNHKSAIHCQVMVAGKIKSHKGLNVPGGNISAAAITKKDLQDLKFGKKYQFDYIALSFVKSAEDINHLRQHLKKLHISAKIIAKIERREAIEHLEDIAKTADALMVARGDLGLEIPAEKVPIIQKEIIQLGLKYAKPTIIATQMLQSMIANPRPTRAEISDAANAVFDQADALMLSNETSVGKYPVAAIKTLHDVAKTVEHELAHHEHLRPDFLKINEVSLINSTCGHACQMARDIKAEYLVLLTNYGITARLITRYRPTTPLISITNNLKTKYQLNLVWGLNHVYFTKRTNLFGLKEKEIINLVKQHHPLKTGDELVIVHIHKGKNLISSLKI